MKRLFSIENTNYAAKGLIFLLIVSLLYSYFLVSISVILLGALALFYRFFSRDYEFNLQPLVLMSLGIVPFLMGMLNSDESFIALKVLQYNAAYLFMPIILILLPHQKRKDVLDILVFFILVMLGSTFPVLWQYASKFDEVTLLIGSGQAISTPIDHVRYSIFIAIAIVFSGIAFYKKESFFGKSLKWIFLICFIYLFAVVHVLAVRSGIVLGYIGVLIAGSYLLWRSKKIVVMVSLWLVIIASPIVAYYTVPSFQNKISYSRYDFSLLKAGKGGNYSDSERFRSLKIGYDTWKSSPYIGVGSGDLLKEIKSRYQLAYSDNGQAKYPHNQVLKIAASAGLIGLIFYLISIYAPFMYRGNWKDPYAIGLISIITFSFLVEATLERSYMLVLYLLFAGLLYRSEKKESA